MKELDVRIDDGVYLDLTEFYKFSLKKILLLLNPICKTVVFIGGRFVKSHLKKSVTRYRISLVL